MIWPGEPVQVKAAIMGLVTEIAAGGEPFLLPPTISRLCPMETLSMLLSGV